MCAASNWKGRLKYFTTLAGNKPEHLGTPWLLAEFCVIKTLYFRVVGCRIFLVGKNDLAYHPVLILIKTRPVFLSIELNSKSKLDLKIKILTDDLFSSDLIKKKHFFFLYFWQINFFQLKNNLGYFFFKWNAKIEKIFFIDYNLI